MKRWRVLAATVAVVAALATGACAVETEGSIRAGSTTSVVESTTAARPTSPPTSTTSTSTSTSTSVDVAPSTPVRSTPVDGVPPVPDAPATALLDGLRVAAVPDEVPDYRRDEFGSGWDYDRASGCNVRELVLIEESHEPPVMGERCKPLSGRWVSLYDEVPTTDPSDLEIDHLVPLAEAWRTGAATWTDQRREAFANDLDDPATLIAVTTRSNRSKGDSPPDEWLPPSHPSRCGYVSSWIRVKARWGLAVSPAEKSTLVQVLSGC